MSASRTAARRRIGAATSTSRKADARALRSTSASIPSSAKRPGRGFSLFRTATMASPAAGMTAKAAYRNHSARMALPTPKRTGDQGDSGGQNHHRCKAFHGASPRMSIVLVIPRCRINPTFASYCLSDAPDGRATPAQRHTDPGPVGCGWKALFCGPNPGERPDAHSRAPRHAVTLRVRNTCCAPRVGQPRPCSPRKDTHEPVRPTTVGEIGVRNRVSLAPMTRLRAGADGVPGPIVAKYYAQRAGIGCWSPRVSSRATSRARTRVSPAS